MLQEYVTKITTKLHHAYDKLRKTSLKVLAEWLQCADQYGRWRQSAQGTDREDYLHVAKHRI